MRVFSATTLIALLFVFAAAPVEAVVAGPGNISAELLNALETPGFTPPLSNLNLVVPDGFDVAAALTEPIPTYLSPLDPAGAVGRGVPGMTGGLTHPACVAETIRRTSQEQPPPNGDFPCVVPTSNASGIVDGVCFVYECRGVASTGLNGLLSALGGLSSLGSIISGIFEKLLQKEPDAGDPLATATPPAPTPPPASELLATDQFQPLGLSKLFSDSADIVRDLLGALNPPGAQPQ